MRAWCRAAPVRAAMCICWAPMPMGAICTARLSTACACPWASAWWPGSSRWSRGRCSACWRHWAGGWGERPTCGVVEAAIMRVVDLQLSFPPLMLALVLVAALGQGKLQVIVALVAAQYAYFARPVHGAALAERQKEYIEAAAAIPLPPLRIALGHLLPNVFPPLIVVGTIHIASTLVLEGRLSFLGVGLPMTEPSLGSLILRGFEYMQSGRIWMSVYPGATLVVIMLAINLVGDQLREVLNPRLK